MMIGDSFNGNNILPCDIKNQLVNTGGFTNYEFVGGKSGTMGSITCKHEGRVGYAIADYVKTDNSQGRGITFPNPYLKSGSVSIKTYCDDNSINYPDIFIVELGINDIENGLIGSLNGNITTLINLIHTEFASAKILLVGVIQTSKKNEQANYARKNQKRMSINQLYDNLASNNNTYLTYVDVGLLFSTEYGYGFAQTQPYRGSDLTYSKIID